MATDESSKIKELSEGVHSSFVNLVRGSFNVLKLARFVSLVGASVAAVAGLLSTSPINADLKTAIIFIGVFGALSAIAGVCVQVLLEEDAAELVDRSRQGLEQAQAYLANRQQIISQIMDMQELDIREKKLHSAMMWALEHAEANLDGKPHNIKELVDGLLNSSRSSILSSIGVTHSDKYSLTVYRVNHGNAKEPFLEVLHNLRADVQEQMKPARQWLKGEGYSGQAWLTKKAVIIEDALTSASGHFPYIPPDKEKGNGTANVIEDRAQYRSVASAPVCLGDENKVWGVVTVTLDRENVFSENFPSASQSQSVKTVDALVQMISLFVTVCSSSLSNIEKEYDVETSEDAGK